MNMNLQFKGRKEGGRQRAGKKEVNSRQRVGGRYGFQVNCNVVWFSKHYSPDHALPSLFSLEKGLLNLGSLQVVTLHFKEKFIT